MRLFFICCLVCCLSFAPFSKAEDNLLQNTSFEMMKGDMPVGWSADMWLRDGGESLLAVVPEGRGGGLCLFIENFVSNDARFVQWVEVEPDTLYRMSGYIRAEGLDPGLGNGASLSIIGSHKVFPELYDTGGEWVYAECYIITDEDQHRVQFGARVGDYSGDNTGKAWFDELSLETAEAIPVGMDAIYLTEYADMGLWHADDVEAPAAEKRNFEGILVWTLLFAALLALLWVLRINGLRGTRFALPVILVLAAAVRLYLMATQPGYPNDIACFFTWSKRMAEVGPNAFYSWDQFADYPPGYMYLLWITGWLMKLFGVTGLDAVGLITVKCMPLIFDLGAICVIYRLAAKKFTDTNAVLLSALYAFNPAVLLVGSAWGQVDGVLAFGLLLTVMFVVQKNWKYALPAYVVTVLMKPQALMAGPLGLAALVFVVAGEKEPGLRKKLLTDAFYGLLLSLAVAFAMLLPFLWGQPAPLGWLLDHYAGTLSGYQNATVNAANLFYLAGGNWRGLDEPFLLANYSVWGGVFMAIVVAGVIALYWRKRDAGTLPFFGALMYIGLYAFGVMMHERYLFPVLLLLVFAYIQKPDWRVLLMLAGFSLTLFINCAVVLRDMHLQLGVGFLPGLISLCNILLAAVGVWIAVDRDSKPLLTPEREPADPTERLSALTAGAGKPVRITRLDVLCMLALTAIYGVIAYTGLGDTKAPQTFWNSVPGETSTAVFDLGDTHDFTMLYYVGINSRSQDTFQVDFSADGEAWYGETLAKLYEGDCFKWLYLLPPVYDNLGEVAEWDERGPLVETARFIRIWREGPQATLFEVGFRDTDGKLLPVIAVSENGGVDAGLLIDEQDTVPEYPGYMNSAYFDEIYHARTGYEHLKGMRTFEWTHPPLGKVLIMFAVKLFGMTPFGWRFMGALMGVLMVPSMYLLGHLLFRRTRYAFMAAFVMAFDMMHLTQTRIATIDSYAVLCIILMYLFMFRYMRMSFFRDGKRSLWPLFFSGLFMGLGCASKWICFYAGLGLAALFFWSMAQRFAEWRAGLRAVDSLSDDVNRRLKRFPQLLLGTFAACIVFFIVIPCAIYYASYIPHMAYEGGLSFAGFWREQVRMFGYHANLLAGHSYQSPWYEWPLILRPMWYYRGLYGIAEGNVSSIVAMGNPVVWWVGCSTMVYLLWSWLKPHLYGRRVRDHRPALLLISFLAQLVPWLFVTRAIFIYHYFGSLPFVMLSIVYALERFGIKNRRAELSVMFGYLAIVAAMFVGFYPIATGSEVSRRWMDAVNWLKNIKLPGWTFGGWLRY